MSGQCSTGRFAARASRRRGQAVAEYSILLVVLLPLLCGAVDLGRAYFMYAELAHAVNIGARYASIDPNVANIRAETIANAGTLTLASGDVTVLCFNGATNGAKDCAAVALGDALEITATAQFSPLTLRIAELFDTGEIPLSATARRSLQ